MLRVARSSWEPPKNFCAALVYQGLEDLPEMDPVQLEDFKAEAEEEIQLKLDV